MRQQYVCNACHYILDETRVVKLPKSGEAYHYKYVWDTETEEKGRFLCGPMYPTIPGEFITLTFELFNGGAREK